MGGIGSGIGSVSPGTVVASGLAGTLSLYGEHDRCTLAALNEAIGTAISGSDPVVTVDLSAVTFIGVAPIAALVQAKRGLLSQSRDLRVVSASRCAGRVIELCGFSELYGSPSGVAVAGVAGALASWVEVPDAPRQPRRGAPDLVPVDLDLLEAAADESMVELVIDRPVPRST